MHNMRKFLLSSKGSDACLLLKKASASLLESSNFYGFVLFLVLPD